MSHELYGHLQQTNIVVASSYIGETAGDTRYV